MRIVVLATDPADGNARLWAKELRARGARTELLVACTRSLPPAELVVAHVLLKGHGRHPAWELARRYEAAGTPLLNSTGCVAVCADKRLTHLAWDVAGLPQPRTWPLAGLAE